jgi:putative transposase
VINRANEGARIFHEDNDFARFLDLMHKATEQVQMRICGYCIMPTHWHLVLWPEVHGSISSYVHWLSTSHAVQCRRRLGRVGYGHVYQGRFRSFPVEGSRYYFNVLRYVEANPLRAGLVNRAEDWRWSSLYERLHERLLVHEGPLSLPADWVDVVNDTPDAGDLAALRASAAASRPYGSSDWMIATAKVQRLEQTLRGRGRPRLARPVRVPVRRLVRERRAGQARRAY